MSESLKLINMQEVAVEQVHWLWYPYIPYGKITVIQGDPGNGKTTTVLAIAAAITTCKPLPEWPAADKPIPVIFQTAEDGLGDTVKPRLLQAGADCSLVHVIDESEQQLSLSDDRIEQAIVKTGAKLFILDPLQAYMGADVDMHRANEIRPLLKRLSLVAERTGCAVVVIGHLNKGMNKSQYRGLGSIDIQAAARSVLTVGRMPDNPYARAIAQGKNNLAPEGQSIAFELDPETGFAWTGPCSITIDQLLSCDETKRDSATSRAKAFLKMSLANGPVPSKELDEIVEEQDFSTRTMNKAKRS